MAWTLQFRSWRSKYRGLSSEVLASAGTSLADRGRTAAHDRRVSRKTVASFQRVATDSRPEPMTFSAARGSAKDASTERIAVSQGRGFGRQDAWNRPSLNGTHPGTLL